MALSHDAEDREKDTQENIHLEGGDCVKEKKGWKCLKKQNISLPPSLLLFPRTKSTYNEIVRRDNEK
jgi:hypothetical protein